MSSIPIDPLLAEGGPDAALFLAAAQLGVELDWDQVVSRFAVHPSSGSLKSLVDVAGSFGLSARAFQTERASLQQLELPVIAHFQPPHERPAVLGVIAGRVDDRWIVLDERHRPSRTLTTDELLREWTGIVVTLKPAEEASVTTARHADWRWKLARKFSGIDGVAKEQRAARWLLLALVGVGSLVGAIGLAGWGGLLIWTALVGGLFASWLLYGESRVTSVPGVVPRLASNFCGRGKYSDCSGVLGSKYSRILGIDLVSAGLSLFAAQLASWFLAGVVAPSDNALTWLLIAPMLLLPGSLFLIGVQFLKLKRVCPLCMLVHSAVITSSGVGLWTWSRYRPASEPVGLLMWGIVWAALVLLAFGLLVPFLDAQIESKTLRARVGWIGATPWGALAEIAGRPRLIGERIATAIEVGSKSAPLRIEALVHPLCSGCGAFVIKLRQLIEQAGDAISVGVHLPPRDPADRGDHELCAAVAAVGLALGGEAGLAAFERAKADGWKLIARARESGADSIISALTDQTQPLGGDLFERARAAVRRADQLATQLERGTPALVVEGRPWEASLEDLMALITRQGSLLRAVLRVRER